MEVSLYFWKKRVLLILLLASFNFIFMFFTFFTFFYFLYFVFFYMEDHRHFNICL